MSDLISFPRRKVSRVQLFETIVQQRETIEALKRALVQRRNPEGSVLTRATVEELMTEIETRPAAEVEAYMADNAPTGLVVL